MPSGPSALSLESFVLCRFAGLGDDLFQINAQVGRHPEQGLQVWCPLFLFDKGNGLARQAGALRQQVEGNAALFTFRLQETGDLGTNGFGCFVGWHTKPIQRKKLDAGCYICSMMPTAEPGQNPPYQQETES